ncbi:putative ubiquitin C-terminal hydrolase [Cladophialophora carrionii]|uniref:Putative ubiquitin C-terminal hydrolase n=1 Tax=Cladophialophora carrionii TaxID=86049 RepID=A0A1C1CXK9_9EURO|nr:putative ubiquitin C-terminal hydrolase [Cladophialophora carrionii]
MSSLISDSSTRNRSDSTEGSELPEHEHKRPRLSDSKPDESHVMSDLHQENAHPAPSVPEIQVRASDNAAEGKPSTPPLPPRTVASPTAMSPTSKVTINTRPLSSQSVTDPTVAAAGPDLPSHSPPSEGPAVCGDSSKEPKAVPDAQRNPADIPEHISLSSSPSKSPEIEVAEPEDFDQDPNQTRWTQRIGGGATSTSDPKFVPSGHVHRTFPFSQESPSGSTHKVIPRMSERLQHTGAQDGAIFRQVKDWMIEFVAMCDDFPLRLLQEERDFWFRLPDLVEALLRREAGPPPGARTEELVDFFVAFAEIAKLLADFDARNLHEVLDESDPRDLKSFSFVSSQYLQALVWILSPRVPFYEYLIRAHSFDRVNFHVLVIGRLGEVSLLRSLSALLTEVCAALPKRLELFRPFHILIQVTKAMMGPMSSMYTSDIDFVPTSFSQLENIRNGAAEIVLQADKAIQHAIGKQLAWLNLETAKGIIDTLNPMISAIGEEIPQIGQDIISTSGVGFADSDLTDLPLTMQYAWKFKILRKFITNGRMELRVYGVETMSSDLVAVHRVYIDNQPYPPMNHPVVRYSVKFIKENQLVDYVVGVDSHPQLIHRAYNVVGFLCVSKTYTDADTDVIWKTIVDSQDPRTVHEVFNLLRNCFNVYELPDLYYICRKLSEYPFERLDISVLQFAASLFDNIRSKASALMLHPGFLIDPITWTLCIKLMREASLEQHACLEQALLIRRDFPQYLSNLLSLGRPDFHLAVSSDGGWDQIIAEVATNLKAHSKCATGDFQVLHCLLGLLGRLGAAEAMQKFDLLGLLVADFAYLREHFNAMLERHVSPLSIEAMYEVRSTCLTYFLLHMPDSFTPGLVQELWTSFYAFSELPSSVRAAAWDKLSHVAKPKQNKDANIVVDLILENHLPTLASHDYNQSVLEFIRTSVQYTIRRTPQESLDSENVIMVPGIERMWKVMLEAPPNSVENEATDFIIRMYLDNPIVTKRPKSVIDATHSSLVDRSVQQVMSSASKLKSYTDGTTSGEDEPMVIIASEGEIRAEELRFDRSLLFLRKFLEGMKLRPRYSPIPDQQAQVLPVFPARRGETIDLNIQVMASKYVTEKMQKVAVGSENTCDELHKYLCEASGFTQFSIFHMGQKVSLAGQTTSIADSKVASGSLIVHKTLNTPDSPPTRSTRATSPVDNKIMHHFDDLYDLLDADERLSREVYTFLSLFSAQTELVRILRSKDKSPTELLPPGKPFKLLYCAKALRSCIEDESFSSNPDMEFLTYSIQTIVQVLPKLDLSNAADQLQMSIAYGLVEALLLAFRAKVPVETSREYIQDHQEFSIQASRLLRFALASQNTNLDEISASAMVKLVLETFVEACLHDDRIWASVDTEAGFKDLIVTAFVQDPRVEVRHSLLEVVVGLTGAIGTKLHLKINNPRAPRSRFPAATIEVCLSHLWTALSEILPRACLHPERCTEASETMLAVLRRIGKSFPAGSLLEYFNQWSSILLEHDHVEVVGQPLTDHVVLCLTKLMLEACRFLKAANALPSGTHIIDRIISQFLFPPISDDGDSPRLPVLDSTVRECLYSLILVLCQGPRDLATLVSELEDDLLPENFFEPFYSHERQSLRTDVGYAGLKNLSNTCYLNSLFSQLFMNVQFREFFLNMIGADGSKQKLVAELAKVFANMQNSYEKSIDPSFAVEAITTYEGEQIDVSVQMDVDEFFNLLFDRIEGQIDPSARDTFKSMYGGQLVQQVKSKECEHISERLEPFSAVQVEIKGKARLEDSLRAYVEGEVLQGENKYSCTSCGRHVDAVKRACLKDVPDNLIFNLKRFDYDIMTGMRTKVNDEFQFPDTLDMAPYTLARLSDEQQPGEPDYFQLTGVIVHSGTADSGHYYSFIRQRPTIKGVQQAWVQFNDQDVGLFDPNQMRDNCFGGISEAGFYHLPKFYSAYMLFYQRTSSIEKIEGQYRLHDAINPVRVPLTPGMEQHIAKQNELYLRSYCAQDPAHAQFVLRLLEHMRRGVEKCSEDHTLESKTINMVLEYVHTISSRFKELPSVEETVNVLLSYVAQCPECARTVANWFRTNRVLEDVVVRSPLQVVRKNFANLFISVFTRLHELLTELDPNDDEHQRLSTEYGSWLKSCLSQMSKLWDVVTKNGRPWTDYFNILYHIHRLGDQETIWILEEDFLEKLIDMIMMHVASSDFPLSRRLKARYILYLNARERNRQFPYQVLIRVLASLLQRIDLHLPADEGYRTFDKKIGLTTAESQALGLNKIPPDLEWLRRLIIGRHNQTAQDVIVSIFASDKRLSHYLANLLTHGLNDRSVNIASCFTRPTLVFCEFCPTESKVFELAQSALESIATVGIEYGKEYYEFVEVLLKLDNVSCNLASSFLEELMLQTVSQWAPTLLLAPTEGQFNTRAHTVDLLKRLLFTPLQELGGDLTLYRTLVAAAQELATSCSNFVQQNFLNPRSRDGNNLQPGQVNQVMDVVENCLRYFDLENAADEEKVALAQAVMAQLRAKADSAVETLSSADWQDNSSELAEMSGDEYEDPLSS